MYGGVEEEIPIREQLIEVQRWARVDPFLPTSPFHVKAYLAHKHLRIPNHRKTKKATTNEEALDNLIRTNPNDEVLINVLEARHLTKAIGYLDDTFLGKDGRLHPRYTFLPKTGRLSSKAPNIMNLPQGKKGDLMKRVADAIRSAIVPTPGYILAEFDWKAIEALLVGYFAQDPDYMRVAKLGVHAYVASFGIGQPADLTLSDEELLGYFAHIKETHPVEYATFKKANHAYNYGQGIFNMAKDIGCTVPMAKGYIDIIDKAAPRVAKWKKDTRLRAHSEGQLINPFGYALSFFEVFTIDGNLGKEASEALAFLPQSTAAAMLRDCLVELGNHPWEGERFRLLIPTHDSISLEVREDSVREVMLLVKDVMEKKWEELGGLVVETEAKTGLSLRGKEMELYKWN